MCVGGGAAKVIFSALHAAAAASFTPVAALSVLLAVLSAVEANRKAH